jgi:hypothetical protein
MISLTVPTHEAIWMNHPMLNESDGLLAECSKPEVLDWLLSARRPEQQVMTAISGRREQGECDPNSWRHWCDAGCDFFRFAWGTPPDFRPHPRYAADLPLVRRAFREMGRSHLARALLTPERAMLRCLQVMGV